MLALQVVLSIRHHGARKWCHKAVNQLLSQYPILSSSKPLNLSVSLTHAPSLESSNPPQKPPNPVHRTADYHRWLQMSKARQSQPNLLSQIKSNSDGLRNQSPSHDPRSSIIHCFFYQHRCSRSGNEAPRRQKFSSGSTEPYSSARSWRKGGNLCRKLPFLQTLLFITR